MQVHKVDQFRRDFAAELVVLQVQPFQVSKVPQFGRYRSTQVVLSQEQGTQLGEVAEAGSDELAGFATEACTPVSQVSAGGRAVEGSVWAGGDSSCADNSPGAKVIEMTKAAVMAKRCALYMSLDPQSLRVCARVVQRIDGEPNCV